MLTRKMGPALAAGCTIVLKPAEATPLCAVEIFKIFEKAGIPAGVVNLVTASDPAPIGETFITSPLVRKITFTGSTEVGKILAKKAAEQVKHVSLELGGHAPFIVFDDADPVYAAKGAILVKFLNTGQACISPNRIFVHRSIGSARRHHVDPDLVLHELHRQGLRHADQRMLARHVGRRIGLAHQPCIRGHVHDIAFRLEQVRQCRL